MKGKTEHEVSMCVGVCGYVQDSPMHKALFWVAVAVLQLDEVNLYSAGTALLEQNLHTLDSLRVFNDKVLNTGTETHPKRHTHTKCEPYSTLLH